MHACLLQTELSISDEEERLVLEYEAIIDISTRVLHSRKITMFIKWKQLAVNKLLEKNNPWRIWNPIFLCLMVKHVKKWGIVTNLINNIYIVYKKISYFILVSYFHDTANLHHLPSLWKYIFTSVCLLHQYTIYIIWKMWPQDNLNKKEYTPRLGNLRNYQHTSKTVMLSSSPNEPFHCLEHNSIINFLIF